MRIAISLIVLMSITACGQTEGPGSKSAPCASPLNGVWNTQTGRYTTQMVLNSDCSAHDDNLGAFTYSLPDANGISRLNVNGQAMNCSVFGGVNTLSINCGNGTKGYTR